MNSHHTAGRGELFAYDLRALASYAHRIELPYEWLPLNQRDDEPFYTPRHLLRECMPRRDAIMADLWALGMESVLGLRDNDVMLIAAEAEGSGLSFDDAERVAPHSGKNAKVFEDLFDKAIRVANFEWADHYIVRATGLHSVEVKQIPPHLLGFPERVYLCDAYEGEGWWARLVFAVRGEE